MINNIYLYTKTTDNIKDINFILEEIMFNYKVKDVFISSEPHRSYYELNKIKDIMKEGDVCIVSNLNSLGVSNKDISNELDWFINNSCLLVIANFDNSYKWGISQPLNKAILSTIKQNLNVNNIQTVLTDIYRKKCNIGRKLINFPDNWEELYSKWENKEITSKEFCEQSGLKKATFYNLMAEYKEVKKSNENYLKKYKIC